MVYSAYFIELNLQICDYAQKRRICRKNCKYAFGENLKLEHTLFCRELRFVAIHALFWRFNIGYFNELNLQICNYAQKRRICRKIANMRQTKTFVAIFTLAERLPTSATLPEGYMNNQ